MPILRNPQRYDSPKGGLVCLGWFGSPAVWANDTPYRYDGWFGVRKGRKLVIIVDESGSSASNIEHAKGVALEIAEEAQRRGLVDLPRMMEIATEIEKLTEELNKLLVAADEEIKKITEQN